VTTVGRKHANSARQESHRSSGAIRNIELIRVKAVRFLVYLAPYFREIQAIIRN